MMDTILNLGLNDEAVEGLARATGNERFAWDAYRRLIQMYGDVVDRSRRATVRGTRSAALKERQGRSRRTSISGHEDLRELVGNFKQIYREEAGTSSRRIRGTARAAVRSVFDSWDTPRAQVYRRANDIPDDLGTAVNVVQMVFGNKGEDSGTGVAFTRDPGTGERALWGEFLVNAQGEDVVAGIRTPLPIAAG